MNGLINRVDCSELAHLNGPVLRNDGRLFDFHVNVFRRLKTVLWRTNHLRLERQQTALAEWLVCAFYARRKEAVVAARLSKESPFLLRPLVLLISFSENLSTWPSVCVREQKPSLLLPIQGIVLRSSSHAAAHMDKCGWPEHLSIINSYITLW